MVSVNVAQLLLEGPGTTRDFEYSEAFPDPSHELHLSGPLAGHAHLTRTSEGILVHTEYTAPVVLECARCLDDVHVDVNGTLDEEFVPSTDIKTGLPMSAPNEDQPLIDEHHEINVDEVLRQNILTNLPLQPLCEDGCPGLCATCGERLDGRHRPHAARVENEPPVDPASPFARLAVLLNGSNEEER